MIDMAAAAASLYGPAEESAPAPDTAMPAPAVTPTSTPLAPEGGTNIEVEEVDQAEEAEEAEEAQGNELEVLDRDLEPGEMALEVPEDVFARREARSFDAQETFADAIDDAAIVETVVAAGMPAEAGELIAYETREILADLGLTKTEGREFVEAFGRGVHEVQTTDREVLADRLVVQMNREFGRNATAALVAARELVARDERVAQVLAQTGAGDSPEVVMQLARAAWRSRSFQRR